MESSTFWGPSSLFDHVPLELSARSIALCSPLESIALATHLPNHHSSCLSAKSVSRMTHLLLPSHPPHNPSHTQEPPCHRKCCQPVWSGVCSVSVGVSVWVNMCAMGLTVGEENWKIRLDSSFFWDTTGAQLRSQARFAFSRRFSQPQLEVFGPWHPIRVSVSDVKVQNRCRAQPKWHQLDPVASAGYFQIESIWKWWAELGETLGQLGKSSNRKRIELDKNLEVEHQVLSQERIMGDDSQNPITEDMDESGKIGVKSMSYNQSQIHSDYDSAESIADSDLEDGQLRKMLASPLYIREREENSDSSRKLIASGKLDATEIQMRRASAHWTQADHSRRESLMSSSSREPTASGKPDAMFSFNSETTPDTFSVRNRSNEPGNHFESCVHSVFEFADPFDVGGSLLEGNKDHLLNQARSELMKQEQQVGSLNCCINELQQQAHAQRLELQDAHHGYMNLEENKLGYKKNYLWRKKCFEILKYEVCTKWERAQEIRVDEFSVKKFRESHETTGSPHNCRKCKNRWTL